MSEGSSSKVSYTRGPYKRTGLYRSKTKGEAEADARDSSELSLYLRHVRNDLKIKFKLSYNRSKILENIQGLIDFLEKQKAKEKRDSLEEQLSSLQEKVVFLEEKLAAQQQEESAWLDSLLQNPQD